MKSKVTIECKKTHTAPATFGDLEPGDFFISSGGHFRQKIFAHGNCNAINPELGELMAYPATDRIQRRVNVHITYEVAE